MRILSNSTFTDAEAKAFGEEMRRLRKEAGFTAKDFATIIDCSAQYVYNIEGGFKHPSPQLAERITSVFGVSVSDMLNHVPIPNECEPSEDRDEYGKKLFQSRMDKKINRSVLAGALGIPVEVYAEFERGECSISPHQRETLNKLLDIDKEVDAVAPVVIKEFVEVPTNICDIILSHVKDLQIDSDEQKAVWRYFTDMRTNAEERRLFG